MQALGVDLDLSDKGLGVRSRRYAMLLDDGVVSSCLGAGFFVMCLLLKPIFVWQQLAIA